MRWPAFLELKALNVGIGGDSYGFAFLTIESSNRQSAAIAVWREMGEWHFDFLYLEALRLWWERRRED